MELKPCPRCQSEQVFLHNYRGVSAPVCGSCHLSGPYRDSGVEAIEWWNTRATDPLLKEMVDVIDSIIYITDDSSGIAGYHLNGNIAFWDEFPEIYNAIKVLQKYHEQVGEL